MVFMMLADGGGFVPTASGMQSWMFVLAGMAIVPFLLMMVTSFTKLVIVGSLIRSALGTQHVPPTQVVTGLALVLSIFIMWPVAGKAWRNYEAQGPQPTAIAERSADADLPAGGVASTTDQWQTISRIVSAVHEPLRAFLLKHSSAENRALFDSLQEKLDHADSPSDSQAGGVAVAHPAATAIREFSSLMAAFVLTEVTEAFWIGLLIFIPFLVVDLVVANLLLAMGMHMMSPTPIALPLKLLLFVLVNGWELVLRGVVLGYV